MAIARTALGELEPAKADAARAAALVHRLGPEHRVHMSARWMEAFLLEYLGGRRHEWEALAAFWTRFIADPLTSVSPIVFDDAALAALAQFRAGNRAEARHLLELLAPILGRVSADHALLNGAVGIAGTVVWELGATELAPAYHRLARAVLAAGRCDYPLTSNELTVARMAAMVGDPTEAWEYFARARTALDASGQRPLRALVDHDEALARMRAGDPGRDRIAALLAAALAAFRALGMTGWAQRVLALQVPAGSPATRRPEQADGVPPAGLTEREVDVLRLVAHGCSDREIGDRLCLSPRTVNAHVRNMLRKTDLANRTELSVWAVEHGLTAREPAG